MKKSPPQLTFFITFTYLDDKGLRRTKERIEKGRTIKEAAEKLKEKWLRLGQAIDIVSWERL